MLCIVSELMTRTPLWEMPLKRGGGVVGIQQPGQHKQSSRDFFKKSDLDSAQKAKPTTVRERSNSVLNEIQ